MTTGAAQTVGRRASLFAMWVFLLVLSLQYASRFVPWNSDYGIPLMMSNDPSRGFYSIYYWGQSRLGGAFYLVASWVSALGFDWSPVSLHTAYVTLGVIGMTSLVTWVPRVGLVACVVALLVTLMSRIVAPVFLSYAHPYALQFPLLIAVISTLIPRELTRRQMMLSVALCFFCDWISLASPLLQLGALMSISIVQGERSPRRIAMRAGPIFVGAIGELILRGLYIVGCKAAFGTEPTSGGQGLDLGHLVSNFMAMAKHHGNDPWVLASTAIALAGPWIAWRWLTACEDTLAWMFGLSGAGVGNFLLTIIVPHIRSNGYHSRYLAVGFVLFAASAGLFLAIVWRHCFSQYRAWLYLAPVVLLLPAWHLSATQPHDQTQTFRAAYSKLRQRRATVVVGGYYEAYSIAGLDPKRVMDALVIEGDTDRTPWSRTRLNEQESLWLVDGHHWIGTGERLSPLRIEYGHALHVDREAPVRAGSRRLYSADYLNATRLLDLPAHRRDRESCRGLVLPMHSSLEPGMIWVRTTIEGDRIAIEADGQRLSPTFEYTDHVLFVLRDSRSNPELRVSAAAEECRIWSAVWIPFDRYPKLEHDVFAD